MCELLTPDKVLVKPFCAEARLYLYHKSDTKTYFTWGLRGASPIKQLDILFPLRSICARRSQSCTSVFFYVDAAEISLSVPTSGRTYDEGAKTQITPGKISAEKPEVRGICLPLDSSDVWSWRSNRVKEAPSRSKAQTVWWHRMWPNFSWDNRYFLDKLCKLQRCFSVNTREATINWSDDLHRQPCTRRNASLNPQNLMCWMFEFGRACTRLLSRQPPPPRPQAWIPKGDQG